MKIVTLVTPLDDELADANWIEYVITRINCQDQDPEIVKNVAENVICQVTYIVPEDGAEMQIKAAIDEYMQNLQAQLLDQQLSVLSIDCATGLAWTDIGYDG